MKKQAESWFEVLPEGKPSLEKANKFYTYAIEIFEVASEIIT